MKKIRILALLLALLMLPFSAFVACGDGETGDDKQQQNKPSGDDDDPKDPEEPGSGNQGNVSEPDKDGTQTGYEMYFHFNAAKPGRLPSWVYSGTVSYMTYERAPYSTYLTAPQKEGGSYMIEKRVGSETDGCLVIYRADGYKTDPYVDIKVADALPSLGDTYILSFDTRLEEGIHTAPVNIQGRKMVGSTATFAKFITIQNTEIYDNAGRLIYGRESNGFKEGWHEISIFVNDLDRKFDVYVDKSKVTEMSVGYDNDSYPDSTTLPTAYRFWIDGAVAGESFFYIDNLAVKNAANDYEIVGEGGSNNFISTAPTTTGSISTSYFEKLFKADASEIAAKNTDAIKAKFKASIFSKNKLSYSSTVGLSKLTVDGNIVDLYADDYGVHMNYYDAKAVFKAGNAALTVWHEFENDVFVGKVSFDADVTNADDVVEYGSYEYLATKDGDIIKFTWNDGTAPNISEGEPKADKPITFAKYNEDKGQVTLYADTFGKTELLTKFDLDKTVAGGEYKADTELVDITAKFIDASKVELSIVEKNSAGATILEDAGTFDYTVDATNTFIKVAATSGDIDFIYLVGKNTLKYGDTLVEPVANTTDTTLAEGESYILKYGDWESTYRNIIYKGDYYTNPIVRSEYTHVLFTFYASEKMVKDAYQFMLIAQCNKNGGNYYMQTFFNSTAVGNGGQKGATYFQYKEGWNTFLIDMSVFAKNKTETTLDNFAGLQITMSGWNNGVNGVTEYNHASDGYHMYLKELTFVKLSEENFSGVPANKVDCKHDEMVKELVTIDPATGKYTCGHASCYHGDYYIYKCSNCGYEEYDNTYCTAAPGAHKLGTVKKVEYPVCGQGEGYTYYDCEVCGYRDIQDKIAAIGHDYHEENYVDGNDITQVSVCKNCGDTITSKRYAEYIGFADKVAAKGLLESSYLSNPGSSTQSWGSFTVSGQNIIGVFEITHKYSVCKAVSNDGVSGYEYTRPTTTDPLLLRDAYIDVNFAANSSSILVPMGSRFACEIDLKLGARGSNGKYPVVSSQIMDRGWGSGGKGVSMFSIDENGTFKLSSSDYTLQLSETEYKNFAFYFTPDTNALTLYVDGVKVAERKILDTVDAAMKFLPCDWRTGYRSAVDNTTLVVNNPDVLGESGSSFCFNNLAYYFTQDGPICVVVDKSQYVESKDVVLTDKDEAAITAPIEVNGEDVAVSFKDFTAQKYVIEATVNGTGLADGTLLTSCKYSKGIHYDEALLSVKGGKLYACGVLVASTTANVKLAIVVDDIYDTVSVYVNGTIVPGGPYAFVDSAYAAANGVEGVVFESECGAYTVSAISVYTGSTVKAAA